MSVADSAAIMWGTSARPGASGSSVFAFSTARIPGVSSLDTKSAEEIGPIEPTSRTAGSGKSTEVANRAVAMMVLCSDRCVIVSQWSTVLATVKREMLTTTTAA